jgi:hypothetical protein
MDKAPGSLVKFVAKASLDSFNKQMASSIP